MRARIEAGVVHSPYPYCPPVHDTSFYGFLMERLLTHGCKTALVCGHNKVTNLELRNKLRLCASWYRRQGLDKGDRVYTHVDNSIESFVAMCSVPMTGATLVSSDCLWSEDDILNKIKIADVTHVLTEERHAEMFTRMMKCSNIKEIFLVDGEKPGFSSVCKLYDEHQQPCEDKEFAAGGSTFMAWTTGTTGLPKCVQRPESHFLGSILGLAAAQILIPEDVLLGDSNISCLPLFSMWLLALHVGAKVVVSKTCRTVPEDAIEVFNEWEAITMFTFPLKLRRILNAMKASEDLAITLTKCLRKILVIGTSIPPALAEELISTFKLDELRSLYGMTESGGCLTAPPRGEVSGTNHGFPVSSTKMKVIDTDTGKILGPLERGEVICNTPFAGTGYSGDQKAAYALTDEDGWIHTGDFGYYDHDGRLFLCGRLKKLLECQTRKFSPSDIEHCLMEHEAVEEVYVLGKPSENIQQLPAAVVVTKSGFTRDQQLAEDLKRYVAGTKRLASFKHLHGGIYFADALPRNTRGKVRSTGVRELLQTLHRMDSEEVPVEDCVY